MVLFFFICCRCIYFNLLFQFLNIQEIQGVLTPTHEEDDAHYMCGNITLCYLDDLKDYRIYRLMTLLLSGATLTFNGETNAHEGQVELDDMNHDHGTNKALGGDV